MKESVSWYVMPGETEAETEVLIRSLGLDGIENLVYGHTASPLPWKRLTVGAHLRYWPTWLDFYRGNRHRVRTYCPDNASLRALYGGISPSEWVATIRRNIVAALAEDPAYLVWHVADCLPAETWTRRFAHSHEEVLRATAELYERVRDLIPRNVYVLFENIFWPGLDDLSYGQTAYFFSLLRGSHTGLMFDTGHMMNTKEGLVTEEEGSAYICERAAQLKEFRSRIIGVHLSASLSGIYRAALPTEAPRLLTEQALFRHISAIDEHRPFRTDAAKRIVSCLEPEYLTHELFGINKADLVRKVKIQQKALR